MSETEKIYQIVSRAVWFLSGVLVGSILTVTRIIQEIVK